jgi:predicted amidohydrolase YtcJ
MQPPDLILTNATVVTLDPDRPRAAAVAVADGLIVATGETREILGLRGPATRVVDCAEAAILPGFHDAHLHLLALASRLVSVDCSPAAVLSFDHLKRTIRERASSVAAGTWVRAWGYDETSLAEGRHPSRHDLDEAAPNHPVRLKHRSGHATVLNSSALRAAGIGAGTPDPAAGVIERDASGEPTGLLLEMDEELEASVPPLGRDELEEGVRLADLWLRSHGITTVQDATPTNDHDRWHLLQGLGRLISPRLVVMPGIERLLGFTERGMAQGHREGEMLLGHAKAMLTLTTGAMTPPEDELVRMVRSAMDRGFSVAIHAVEEEAVAAAARVLGANPPAQGAPRHRIEHASECPPDVLALVAQSGATVVTNPGFVHFSGDRYRAEAPPESQPWLYRLGALERAGVRIAFGSDAPVELPDPAADLYGAVTRRSVSGAPLNPGEAVSAATSLGHHTVGGACAAGIDGWLGWLRTGMAADLVVLDRDPTACEPEALLGLRTLVTVVGGRVVWEA